MHGLADTSVSRASLRALLLAGVVLRRAGGCVLSCSCLRVPQRIVVREAQTNPPRRPANKLLAACCLGRAMAMGWRGRAKWASRLHLPQLSMVPLDHCLTTISIAATPLSISPVRA
jgi:hypothetical protein